MSAIQDSVAAIDENADARMNVRTKPRVKEAVQKAAALTGMTDSAFTMNAAYERAIETIEAYERTALKAIDHDAFFSALDDPPAPNEELRAAAARFKERVVSK